MRTLKKANILRRIAVEVIGDGESHRPQGMTLCFILLVVENYGRVLVWVW